jgi:hypothetical protein
MRSSKIFLSVIVLALTVMACTISVNTLPVTTAPGGSGDGGTIPTVTETGLPPLPPPVMAIPRATYIKGGNVWVWTEGSGSWQATSSGNASNPRLSSDGTMVAYTRNGELCVVNADGTNNRTLVNTSYLATMATVSWESIVTDRVVWVPGSHEILFTTLSIAEGSGYQLSKSDLNGIDADASGAVVVNYASEGSGGVPYPSPDGTIIAMAQSTKVIFMQLTGSLYSIALTFPSVSTYSEWTFVPELTWLPGGDAVRLVVPPADPLYNPTAPSQFWNVPVSGSPSVLASFVSTPAFFEPTYISPDGNNVAFLRESSGNMSVYSINAAATETYYVWYPSGSVGLLGWTPDSIHFMIWNPTSQNPNYITTGTLMGLVDTPSGTNIQWLDPTHFLFLNEGEFRLKSMDSPSTLIDSGVVEYSHGIVID